MALNFKYPIVTSAGALLVARRALEGDAEIFLNICLASLYVRFVGPAVLGSLLLLYKRHSQHILRYDSRGS